MRCGHCGQGIERASAFDDSWSWLSTRTGSFRCYGAIHHRPDLPRDLSPDAVRSWLG